MPSDPEAFEALKQVDLFASLDNELLEALAQASVVATFEVGDRLIAQGSDPDCMWVILEGEVDLLRNSENMTTFGPGQTLGDVSLLSGLPHTVDVVAKTSGSRVILGMAEFRSAVRFHPDVAFEVIKVLASRIHAILERFDSSVLARQATNHPTPP